MAYWLSDTVPVLRVQFSILFYVFSPTKTHTTNPLCSFLGKPFDEMETMPVMDYEKNRMSSNTNSLIDNLYELKIRNEFLKILKNKVFNVMYEGDVIDHIAKLVKITEWIKIPDIDKNRVQIHVFSKSLSGDAKNWWNDKMEGRTISWNELSNEFFHKYYPLSHACKSKTPDDLDNRTDYFEFLYWLASKFDNHWEIDKTTRSGLWELYMNECTKGTIGNLDEYKEPYEENAKKVCSNSFYKPYFDAQNRNYKIINKECSLILAPARHDICDQGELCRTEEFAVVKYLVGLDKEFVVVGPSEISTMERSPGSMSCIYHDLFNKKDEGWTVQRTK
ncbi:hypothetical protein Tco_0007035 [Tanacetum coccineum]